jgi:hypothetical protein
MTNAEVLLLESITKECIDRGVGEIVCVRSPRGNINAAGSFLFSGDRLIFSVCASTPEGHKNQAMHFLVNHQINQYAGRHSILDFSGSEIKGIAYFNSTFGAKPVTYPMYHRNRMPLLLKVLAGKR